MGVCPPELDNVDEPGTLESAVPPPEPRVPGTMSTPASATGFRRRLERLRGAVSDGDGFSGSEDEAELKLQLVLLREENTRLKAARHQPAGPGSAIDQVRSLASAAQVSDGLDDAYSLIGECLAVREGLDQVCLEMGAALDAVRGRLQDIAAQAEASLVQAQDAARITA